MREISVPYGLATRQVSIGPNDTVVAPQQHPKDGARLVSEIADALAAPVQSRRLEDEVGARDRVLIVVSDPTRDEPRAAMVSAVLDRIPARCSIRLAVATGTHGPCDLNALGLGEVLPGGAGKYASRIEGIVNHDGHASLDTFCEFGVTRRGTPMRVNSWVAWADFIVLTGSIQPHYFAGYSGGVKGLFPGLGENTAIRINHQHKTSADARAGCVDGNPCREDMEEVLEQVEAKVFALNVLASGCGVVAGDPVASLRAGGARVGDVVTRTVNPAHQIVVVAQPPISQSLYQASKLVASVSAVLAPGGRIVIFAPCELGVDPIDVVNSGIYELGLRPSLPRDHQIYLVSALPASTVKASYCEYAPSLEEAIDRTVPTTWVVDGNRLLLRL